MFQRLLWLVALCAMVWAARRLLTPGARSRDGRGGDGVPTHAADDMVRDRVCNTYLPRKRALSLGTGDGELFFCSERCRRIHMERKAS